MTTTYKLPAQPAGTTVEVNQKLIQYRRDPINGKYRRVTEGGHVTGPSFRWSQLLDEHPEGLTEVKRIQWGNPAAVTYESSFLSAESTRLFLQPKNDKRDAAIRYFKAAKNVGEETFVRSLGIMHPEGKTGTDHVRTAVEELIK